MSEARIHLNKTLCAMRRIALMNDNQAVASAVAQDMERLS